MVAVKLMSPALRARHGARRVEIDAPDVDTLLRQLAIEDDRDLRVLVNGRSIALLDGRATALAAGDAVAIYTIGIRGWPGG